MAVKVLRTLSMDEANVLVDRLGSPRGPCKSVSLFPRALFYIRIPERAGTSNEQMCAGAKRYLVNYASQEPDILCVYLFVCLFVSFISFFLVEFLSENQKGLVFSE